jgi:hypothetical protein
MELKRQQFISKTANLKNTMFLGFLLLVMSVFIMPEAAKEIERCAHGTFMLDGIFYYSPDKIHSIIGAYGEKGRKLYIAVELSADFIYGIIIALFLCFLIIWSASISKNRIVRFRYFIWLPFLYLLANCMENSGIIFMLCNYPKPLYLLALATLFFSFAKFILLLACLILISWNLVIYAKTKSNPSPPINTF